MFKYILCYFHLLFFCCSKLLVETLAKYEIQVLLQYSVDSCAIDTNIDLIYSKSFLFHRYFHLALTIQSYARHLNIKTIRKNNPACARYKTFGKPTQPVHDIRHSENNCRLVAGLSVENKTP